MLKNTANGYGLVAIVLHWLSAVAVFGMFGLGLYMVDLSYYDPFYRDGLNIHKSIGILLAIVIVIRLLWKWLNPKVEPLQHSSTLDTLQNKAATLAHWLMYFVLFALFCSGYLISTSDGRAIEVFGWFAVPSLGELFEKQSDIAGTIHLYLAWGLIALVAVHALAALKHHFVNRDRTLIRMFKMTNSDN